MNERITLLASKKRVPVISSSVIIRAICIIPGMAYRIPYNPRLVNLLLIVKSNVFTNQLPTPLVYTRSSAIGRTNMLMSIK